MSWGVPGVELGRRHPAMQIANSAGGRPKVVSGVAAHRALKGRSWWALATPRAVLGHPVTYAHVVNFMAFYDFIHLLFFLG